MMIVSKGDPLRMGCQKVNRSYNFSYAGVQSEVALLIFDSKGSDLKYRIEMNESYKTGVVFSCRISGVSLDRCLYCYETEGERLIDPYAKTITDCELFGIEKECPVYLSRVELDAFDWGNDRPLSIPYHECIFYKLNVRGFTKSRTSGVKHKGTFAGIIEKIPYLKELGITTLELMPAYEFDEMQRFHQLADKTILGIYSSGPIKTPVNYWGYGKGFHFTPKASFSSAAFLRADYTVEFKKMVKMLHTNGIEVVMEMYFDTESPAMIADCLRYWVTEYHIDGIHLYGDATSISLASADPVLARTKIIANSWNNQTEYYGNMAVYHDGFSVVAKKFLKGDENQLADFVNVNKYHPLHSAVLNYVTNHNGFTMLDMVSYDRKHNEANGENNRDGENFNHSWNCGVEGKSRKKKIVALRQKQMKNAFMLLLLSQGTPLILAGDEFENSQGGNNNPYCIDGETSWLNWKIADTSGQMQEFVKELIRFRNKNHILHRPKPLMACDQRSCGYPDISYHGSSAWYNTMEPFNRHIGIMYCSRYAQDECIDSVKVTGKENGEKTEDLLIYVAYNMHWEPHELALPKVADGCIWKAVLCSGDITKDVQIRENRMLTVESRTTVILLGNIKP